MSGQYTPHHGIYMVGSSNRGAAQLKRLVPIPNVQTLRPDIITIPEALKAGGYTTCHVGKWHLGNDPDFGPHGQGYDVNIAGSMSGMPQSYFSPYKMKMLSDGPEGEYLTDRLTEEACGFMAAHRDTPFFLYMSHYAVHVPLEAKQELIAKYEAKPPDGEQNNPTYAAMIESMDQGVGRLMAVIDELGIADNTLVVFYSDNGGQLGITEQKPLRAGKGYLYEGGIRVPMIVRWPRAARVGRRCSTPVIGTDLYPTFLEAAGVRPPTGHHLSGESMVRLLAGGDTLEREAIYWHFPGYQPGSANTFRITPSSVVRKGPWKLTEHFEDGRLELYNLDDDIGETTDLAAVRPEKARELKALLDTWHTETEAGIPREPNPEYRPAQATATAP
jgi:arylsulfatase A-like enzyme